MADANRIAFYYVLDLPPCAGVLASAGGLVFSGTNEGNFFALDANTGKAVRDFQAGELFTLTAFRST